MASPYTVEERVGEVNYRIRTPDHRKKTVVYHVNMLQKWHEPTCLPATDVTEDIPFWNDTGDGVGQHLTQLQTQDLHSLLTTQSFLCVPRPPWSHNARTASHSYKFLYSSSPTVPYSSCIQSRSAEGVARHACSWDHRAIDK